MCHRVAAIDDSFDDSFDDTMGIIIAILLLFLPLQRGKCGVCIINDSFDTHQQRHTAK